MSTVHLIQPTEPLWVTYLVRINFKDREEVESFAEDDPDGDPGEFLSGPYRLVAWAITDSDDWRGLGIPRPIGHLGDCEGAAHVGATPDESRDAAKQDYREEVTRAHRVIAQWRQKAS